MLRNEFLNKIINAAIATVTTTYAGDENLAKRNGAIDGLEICRNKSNVQLLVLQEVAKYQVIDVSFPFSFEPGEELHDIYWYNRSYQEQIDWVLNVLSAALHGLGREPLTDFTLTGYLTAAKIFDPQVTA